MIQSLGNKILLLANKEAGREVANFLVESGDTIVSLYLSDMDNSLSNKIIEAAKVPANRVFKNQILQDSEHLEWLKKEEADFLITVYWPYLLKPYVFKIPKKSTVNFHPALLPINRGWHPHIHSILDGSPVGVTLHVIDENADTGPIWAQKEIPLLATDTAKTLYDRLQSEIVDLFKQQWCYIKSGKIQPKPQEHEKANYHAKSEIDHLNYIDLNRSYTGKELINLLRARSFGDLGFAYYEIDGKRVYLNLRLNEDINFAK